MSNEIANDNELNPNMDIDSTLKSNSSGKFSPNIEIDEKVNGKLPWKRLVFIGAVAVIIISLILGISIYNLPANRLSRQLDLGQKYLVEQNYEQAIVAFDKAIAIDPMNAEAYVGKSDAYIGIKDYDNAIEILKRGRQETSDNEDVVNKLADTYINWADNYAKTGDMDSAIKILEEGYKEIDGNNAIKTSLIEDYLVIADKGAKNGAYADSLKYYDRLLEIDMDNDKIIQGLNSCLSKYLDVLMIDERYDEIKALATKYKNMATGVDFDRYLKEIAEIEKIKAENDAFMQKVYDLMSAEDYVAMFDVDGSEEAIAFVERMQENNYTYIPGNKQTGIGSGVYKTESGGYYFFYGNIVDGIREGKGTSFWKRSSSDKQYEIFEGEWSQDAPNGIGTASMAGITGLETVNYFQKSTGNLVNGLWEGDVKVEMTLGNGKTALVSFTANDGIPEDRTSTFISKFPAYRNYIGKGFYVITWYSDHNGVLWLQNNPGLTMGALGFSDN